MDKEFFDSMNSDVAWWTNLVPPAAPSDADVATYKQFIVGPNVLLLGSTKELLDLATVAYDLHPKYDNPKIFDRNWITVDSTFDTIIGDGVFVFDEQFNFDIVELVSKHCKRFIVRSFVYPPVWPARYAKVFPKKEDFEIEPTVIKSTATYIFFMWDFE